jgi:hypothetical protein
MNCIERFVNSIFKAKLDPGWKVGSATRGTPLTVVVSILPKTIAENSLLILFQQPMVGGTIKSEAGFEPEVDAELFVKSDA